MSTIGWICILMGALVFRAVSRGRAANFPEDMSDAFLALLRGDTTELTAVLTRTGDGNDVAQGALTPEEAEAWADAGKAGMTALGNAANIQSSKLLQVVMIRGKKAKGYVFGATGPDYYDCSGLVWRGCQDIGYKGGRFTTFDIQARKGFTKVTGRTELAVQPGDIVLWPRHHMGVVSGPNKFYSARNPRSGISDASISGFRSEAPIYVRFTGA